MGGLKKQERALGWDKKDRRDYADIFWEETVRHL